MFCSKCGNELADDAKFCSKCGSAVENVHTGETVAKTGQKTEAVENASSVSNESVKESVNTNKVNFLKRYIDRYKNRWKQCKQEHFKGRKNIGWIAVNVIIALVVIYNIAISFICNRDLNGLVYYRSYDGYAYARNNHIMGIHRPLLGKNLQIKDHVRIGFKTYEVASVDINVEGGKITKLSTVKGVNCVLNTDKQSNVYIDLGAMPKVETIYITADKLGVHVENHKNINRLNLTSAETTEKYDYSYVYLSGDIPNLEELTLKNVRVNNYYSTTEKLTRVNMVLPNKDFSEYAFPEWNFLTDRMEITLSNTFMYLSSLPNSNIEITHTIEDLIGTWNYYDSDRNVVFSVTFQDTGYVRIRDDMGMIGVDLFTFSEIDDNTLLLKAETPDYWGDLLTFDLPYELYGSQLHISIYGYEMDLINEDSSIRW